jgi:hypothetical protein
VPLWTTRRIPSSSAISQSTDKTSGGMPPPGAIGSGASRVQSTTPFGDG